MQNTSKKSPLAGGSYRVSKLKLELFFLTIIFCGFFGLAKNASAGTAFYVDPSAGSDGVGSYASPWKYLSSVNSHNFSTGDDVYFKAGTTMNVPAGQYLDVVWNGTSGDHVVIGAYYGENQFGLNGGARPIFDGLNAAPSHDTYHGFIDKFNYCQEDCNANKVSAYLDIKDIRINNSGEYGIALSGISHATIQNCYVYRCWASAGILVGRSDDFLVDGNTIEESHQNPSGAGATIEITASANSGTCFNGMVTNNTVFNSRYEGIGVYMRASDIVVKRNIVYNIDSFALYASQNVDHIVFAENIIYANSEVSYSPLGMPGVAIGNEDFSSVPGDIEGVVVVGNVMANCHNSVVFFTDNYGYDNKRVAVFNNTFIDPYYWAEYGGENIKFWMLPGWTNNYFKNNISYVITAGLVHASEYSPEGFTWDHNLFSSSVSGNAATNAVIAAPGLNKTSGWQSLDGGSLTFSSTDYLLASESSAAVNVGTWLTTIASSGSGTNVIVTEPAYFGRTLYYGFDNNADGTVDFIDQVVWVDYITSTVTLAGSHSYTAGGRIYRAISPSVAFNGSAPDIGAYEYENESGPDVTPPADPTGLAVE